MSVAEIRRLQEIEAQNAKLKRMLAEQMLIVEGLREINKKVVSPAQRPEAAQFLVDKGISQRRACHLMHLPRSLLR
jgi:hypothetical protein